MAPLQDNLQEYTLRLQGGFDAEMGGRFGRSAMHTPASFLYWFQVSV